MKIPVVTIVGRPNVGKSTLFNRIIQKREAIVDDLPGVTRDRKFADTDWSGWAFTLIDTGGYFPNEQDKIGREVLRQVEIGLDEAEVVLFVVDGRDGLTGLDEEIGQVLKKVNKPVVLVANKVDDARLEANKHEFYALGLGEPVDVSASSGRNVGDMLDVMLSKLPPHRQHNPFSEDEDESADRLHLAVVGKPNAGKSSFINAILGEEKQIVTDVPGTTRDAVDTLFRFHGEEIVLVDTAGLRRRTKIQDNIEYYSTVRSLEAIRRSHVSIVIIDATEGLTDQDFRIINEVVRFKKGLVLAVNKWDLIEKDPQTAHEMEKELREQLHTLRYAPIIFISALHRKRVFKIVEIARDVHATRQEKVTTSLLNRFLAEVVEKYPPPSMDRKEVKINYITQVKQGPPVFALFMNHPDALRANYRQYLENQFRDRFPYIGVPLTFVFKKK